MKKYSWSLNKCLEFIASKKENLDIRNNYLSQLQDLHSRMSKTNQLSCEWKNTSNEEELLLANTFANAKVPKEISEETKLEKKTNHRRINWADKPTVHKIGSHYPKEHQKALAKHKNPLKSILKGFQDPEEETIPDSNTFEDFEEETKFQKTKKSN